MMTSRTGKAARALLRWAQADLAEAVEVSLPSIKRLETSPENWRCRLALSRPFAPPSKGRRDLRRGNGEGPGVRLKKKKAKSK